MNGFHTINIVNCRKQESNVSRILSSFALICLAACAAYASDFEGRLAVGAAELKASAVRTAVPAASAPAVMKDLYASDDAWWRGGDADRVRQKFTELTNAAYQMNTSHGPISDLAARARVCDALKTISWEGTVDPANIDRVIDWMDHNVDGLYGQLSQIRVSVGTWVSMGPWAPCISKQSRYLSDRIRLVTGH